MSLFLKLQLGDQVELVDTETSAVTVIEIDRTRKRSVRLRIDAPKHIRIERVPLDTRCAAEDLKPGRHPRPVNECESPRSKFPFVGIAEQMRAEGEAQA